MCIFHTRWELLKVKARVLLIFISPAPSTGLASVQLGAQFKLELSPCIVWSSQVSCGNEIEGHLVSGGRSPRKQVGVGKCPWHWGSRWRDGGTANQGHSGIQAAMFPSPWKPNGNPKAQTHMMWGSKKTSPWSLLENFVCHSTEDK